MPFLRRRGVMASENDMRRHTFIEPDPPSQSGLAPFKPKASAPRKSLGNDLLDPNAAANGHGRTSVDSQTAAKGAADPLSGERSRTDDPNNDENNSFESNMPSLSTSMSLGRPSEDPFDRPESPPIQEETPKHRRFSMLRFRNASDSQLSVRMRQQQLAEKPPPLPTQTPSIITTAPTIDSSKSPKKSRMKLPIKIRRSGELPRPSQDGGHLGVSLGKKDRRKSMAGVVEEVLQERNKQNVSFQDGRPRPYSSKSHPGPRHNDQANSALSLPANRLSESERSEASSGEHSGGFGNTAPAANASSTSSSIFRLGRRKQKQPEPMFPLAHLPQQRKNSTLTPTISNNSMSNVPATSAQRPSTGNGRYTPVASPSFGPSSRAPGSPATALFRPGSRNSGQGSPTRAQLGLRERSSTMSSLGRNSEDHQFPGTARTSTSIGRKSFGDLLGLGRLRNNPDLGRPGTLTPATPGSLASKNNSLQLPREKESVVLPERREDESAAKYLARLEDVLSRGVIAAALSKGSDPWSASVLRSYMRTFGFFEQPMDMAIRKLLMEAELPKETQQIDRCLQAFANRYHECNPGIYSSPDQAYFVAFSLLILHTDVFNRNNKYKMQKADYLKNTRGEGIFDDVLECFYDNITYTPFIHVEDDFDINGDPVAGSRTKKKVMFPNGATEAPKRTKDPIDPYTLILDGKLDTLRPPLKEQMPLEEHYNYIGTAKELNIKELQKTFFKTGVLQIVSARSRPDAFMTEKTLSNPQEAEPGIVDIKVTKVGTLWRKDAKKKKTRSPWQEWGAILTGAQLYFFRNTAWVKSLVHQYDTHVKSGNDGIPLIFKPPLESFKPDALMSTEGAVALFDQSYKKHKNAFVYVRHGGFEEVLLAHDEDDRNDWLAKLNYAAAFRTSGVRMRGVVGGNLEGQGRRAIRRLDSSEVTQVIQTPTGEVSINRSRIDHQMAHDILAARRFMMSERIAEGEDKLQAAQRQLDDQLRNARHLLLLAPIQEKTREQVRTGAAKLIAQLRWSRTEIWRLKCHMDILLLDLEEDKHINGDLEDSEHEPSVASDGPSLKHKESLASSHKTTQQSPRAPAPLSLALSSGNITQTDGESPMTEVFQTPPTSATTPIFPKPQTSLGSMRPQSETTKPRKASVSSAASSAIATMSPPRQISSPGSDPEMTPYDELNEEDANERQVLEQAGLLDAQISRTSDRPGSSKGEDTPERHKRSSISASDKDKSERSKIRRSLQRTLRESTGHLAHHRSKKGHDSASSGVIADDMARDDVLTRGTGSFTLHGKKASVVNFGSDLQGMTSNEHIRQRKQPLTEELVTSPLSADDDDAGSLHGAMSLMKERRESAASASTATARSFRELHRKYSSAQNAHRVATGGLVVPSDDDSDAAISFSDGRRTPLPPVEDGSGDEDDSSARRARAQSKQSVYFTPEPPSSPVEEVSEDEDEDGGATQHTHEHERFSPPTQSVSA